jgi:hypothetical protein
VDHDLRVVARKTVRVKAFRLGEALDWAVQAASWRQDLRCLPPELASDILDLRERPAVNSSLVGGQWS